MSEHSKTASIGTFVFTAWATRFSVVRSGMPEISASLKAYHVKCGMEADISGLSNLYSKLPTGLSDIYLTLSVSPVFPTTELNLIQPEISLPKSTFHAFSPVFSSLTGLSVSVTLSTGPTLAVSLPSGAFSFTACSHEASSKPGMSQPSTALDASYFSPRYKSLNAIGDSCTFQDSSEQTYSVCPSL